VTQADVLILAGAALVAALLVVVVRLRVRSHGRFAQQFADDNVCEHLRPAWELLRSRGHRAARVGQKAPDLPLEIHVQPTFDPRAVYDELKLAEPVFVSERNVLYCKQDWCELHPVNER
jgi:hypothetical protein